MCTNRIRICIQSQHLASGKIASQVCCCCCCCRRFVAQMKQTNRNHFTLFSESSGCGECIVLVLSCFLQYYAAGWSFVLVSLPVFRFFFDICRNSYYKVTVVFPYFLLIRFYIFYTISFLCNKMTALHCVMCIRFQTIHAVYQFLSVKRGGGGESIEQQQIVLT